MLAEIASPSEFLDSFLKIEKDAKQNTILQLKTTNDAFKCGLHLTVRVSNTKRYFSEHVISYCAFKIMILEMEKKI